MTLLLLAEKGRATLRRALLEEILKPILGFALISAIANRRHQRLGQEPARRIAFGDERQRQFNLRMREDGHARYGCGRTGMVPGGFLAAPPLVLSQP